MAKQEFRCFQRNRLMKEFYDWLLETEEIVGKVWGFDAKKKPTKAMAFISLYLHNMEPREWVAFRDGVSEHCKCCKCTEVRRSVTAPRSQNARK